MKGRDKCELLNEVRQKIAEKNNIEFTVYECTFEGDCTGTCPKCESEVRYLEEELAKKQARGEKINLEGIFNIEETCPGYIEEPPTEEGDGTYELLGTPLIEEPLNEINEDELTELLGKPLIDLDKDRDISEDGIIDNHALLGNPIIDIDTINSRKKEDLEYRIQELEILISEEEDDSFKKEIQATIDKLTEELEELEDFTDGTMGMIAPDEEL